MTKGYLLLESGDIFEGDLIGSKKEMIGEVVFNTSMSGYQEIITDPSYAGQIVTFCYPLIGNYGINLFDNESKKPHLSGVIVSELCDSPSHYLMNETLQQQLEKANITGLANVDTRAIVKLTRKYGTLKGMIVSKEPTTLVKTQIISNIVNDPYTFWVDQVSSKDITTHENEGPHIVLIDYGYKKSILDSLLNQKCKVTVVPYSITFEQICLLKPDGIVFSNGPGDPMEIQPFFSQIKKITENFPSLGICLGHQVIALAYGAKTEKLTYGHRGGNHPVKEIETGKIWITSQNHGYVVTEESIDSSTFKITFLNVNDHSIEGLQHQKLPIQTVQFHPEANPGPNDTNYIFEKFLQQLEKIGEMKYAFT